MEITRLTPHGAVLSCRWRYPETAEHIATGFQEGLIYLWREQGSVYIEVVLVWKGGAKSQWFHVEEIGNAPYPTVTACEEPEAA